MFTLHGLAVQRQQRRRLHRQPQRRVGRGRELRPAAAMRRHAGRHRLHLSRAKSTRFGSSSTAGERGVRSKLNYLEPPIGNESARRIVQVFDPNGTKVVPGTCPRAGDTVQIPEPVIGGVYTALVSACIGTRTARLPGRALPPASCADRSDDHPLRRRRSATASRCSPSASTQLGRPIFDQQLGYGLLAGRRGARRREQPRPSATTRSPTRTAAREGSRYADDPLAAARRRRSARLRHHPARLRRRAGDRSVRVRRRCVRDRDRRHGLPLR